MSTPRKKLSEIVSDVAKLKQQWASTKPAPDADCTLPCGRSVQSD